jgi:succinoglycan biosynthesis protein ExoM
MITVSICIATYRRPERLAALLHDLAQQRKVPDEVIIVDNDAAASARAVVARHQGIPCPFPIRYEVQPLKNISLTRNKTVELAQGEWLAFIDDDERAAPTWLEQMLAAAHQFGADGILGPVVPILPESAPAWIQRGRFYDFPRMATGTVIAPNRLRFGNVLLRGALLRGLRGPFDPAYGLTGGEDGDLLARLGQHGARLVWCDEAIVQEPVEANRLSLQWLLRRALSGGQDLARHTLAGRYGKMSRWSHCRFFLRALLQMFAAALLALVSWPLGRHVAAHWLVKVSANFGKFSVLWGGQYREYQ